MKYSDPKTHERSRNEISIPVEGYYIMSVEIKAVKGATWLAIFKFSGQAVSWVATVIVARILVPGDYGLMAMATVITGYAFIFNELGIGQAIIQNSCVTEKQLSSVFWFSMLLSLFFALFAFVVAYPTALIFNEPRVIPLTQATSILFILSGLQIVPQSMLLKDMKFRSTGYIDMMGVLVSSICMIIIAKLGGGVWTLLGGHIIRSFTRITLLYYVTGWKPFVSFQFRDAKQFIQFGLVVAIGKSLFYVYEKSDRFFAGRVWPAGSLGYYTFAMQLAVIPTDKIVSIINQVSYSALAAIQHERERFKSFYLNVSKITATLVLPIFCGGFLLGDNLIRVLLTDQWYPMIPLFRYLCLVQIFVAISALNGFVHSAMGRPGRNLILNITLAIFMPISFYFAVQYSVSTILVPWFTTYLLINSAWMFYTLKKIEIPVVSFMNALKFPVMATVSMVAVILLIDYYFGYLNFNMSKFGSLAIDVFSGAAVYGFFLWKFDNEFVKNIKLLRK